MKDVIRKYLCNSCLGKKEECMKYKEEQKNGIIQYKCEGYIYNIAVKFKYRRFGIGKDIVNELVNYSKNKNLKFLSLEVRKSNAPAINLYSNCGFEKVGNRKNYYTNPLEDAIIMTKFL